MTTAGITIRRRNRKDGIDPLRTHSYAVDREMPRRCAACSTERVAGPTGAPTSAVPSRFVGGVRSRRDMAIWSAWDVPGHVP